MRSGSSKYHLAVKDLKKNEHNLHKEPIREANSSGNQRNLWDKVQRALSSEINGVTEPLVIARVYMHYTRVFQLMENKKTIV